MTTEKMTFEQYREESRKECEDTHRRFINQAKRELETAKVALERAKGEGKSDGQMSHYVNAVQFAERKIADLEKRGPSYFSEEEDREMYEVEMSEED